jgi:arylformamidase
VKSVDLTLTISQKIPTFPGSPTPSFIPWEKLRKDGYNLELLFLSSHTGTHVDAPFHFLPNGSKIHQINPGRFLRDARLIRVRAGPRYAITKSDIVSHEEKFGRIEDYSTIVFATGWNDKLDKVGFFEENPGLSVSAARYLVSKKTNLVGIDSPSIDVGSNKKFSAHHILLKGNVLILENLCNLSKIKRFTFKLAALPLKLQNATGSPVRAVAF